MPKVADGSTMSPHGDKAFAFRHDAVFLNERDVIGYDQEVVKNRGDRKSPATPSAIVSVRSVSTMAPVRHDKAIAGAPLLHADDFDLRGETLEDVPMPVAMPRPPRATSRRR